MDKWLEAMVDYLKASWGIHPGWSARVALLYAYLWSYGLQPKITSGFRDPSKQKAMQARWDAGDRAGLVRRPASNSLHTRVDGSGNPCALAIDIDTSNREEAGRIAMALNIGWGGNFSGDQGYDPVHFYDKSGAGGL